MTRPSRLTHVFVEYLPDKIARGKLYISMQHATAAHQCCCGCGREVVTPLSPKDWQLTYDGRSISLTPSIGNWSYPCRSHYWIRHDRVVWADTPPRIEGARLGVFARIWASMFRRL
jgi:hypothetical protein